MKVNYGMTEIKLGEEKQIVNYFITKNEGNYGIKIEKEINGKLKDEAEVNDISNNENVVRNIIDELISNNNGFRTDEICNRRQCDCRKNLKK